jgi:hypothetical protein
MEEPEKVMAGGNIGRPPWGVISASSPGNAPPAGITSALTSILGVSYNPKELEQQLILTERQYQQITLEIFEVEQKLTRKKKEYIDNLGSYAKSLSDSKKAEIDINFYKKKMEVKELSKERRKQLNDIISNKDKSDADRQAAKDELAAGNSGKQNPHTRCGLEHDHLHRAPPDRGPPTAPHRPWDDPIRRTNPAASSFRSRWDRQWRRFRPAEDASRPGPERSTIHRRSLGGPWRGFELPEWARSQVERSTGTI